MFTILKSNRVKLKYGLIQVGVLVLLTAQSLLVQAAVEEQESTDQAVPATDVQATAGTDQQASEQQVERAAVAQASPWPRRSPHDNMGNMHREMAPPPPPGPYMSTALSNNTLKGMTFEQRQPPERLSRQTNSPENTMDRFSPDREWPTNLRPVKRWQPDSGYHFVAPPVIRSPASGPVANGRSYPAAPNRALDDNRPMLNSSGSRPMSSRNTGLPGRTSGYSYPSNTQLKAPQGKYNDGSRPDTVYRGQVNRPVNSPNYKYPDYRPMNSEPGRR